MKIVVDTNLVFSAVLNTQSTIGDLILNSNNIFQFWSCHFLLEEINKHWNKLKEVSELEEENLLESYRVINNNIKFIDEGLIPKKYRLTAYELVKDIDLKDIVFVAINEYQKAILWSGDKSLVKGLRGQGYDKVITTNEMKNLRYRIEHKK
jgi:predicted nucleic acid-binding protein